MFSLYFGTQKISGVRRTDETVCPGLIPSSSAKEPALILNYSLNCFPNLLEQLPNECKGLWAGFAVYSSGHRVFLEPSLSVFA